MSYLSLQTSLEQAENAIKQMEGFMNTMDANDEKINGVLQNADKLADEDHYNADKVGYVNISLYWFTHDSKSLRNNTRTF